MEREVSKNERTIDELSDTENDAEKETKGLGKAVKDSGDSAGINTGYQCLSSYVKEQKVKPER